MHPTPTVIAASIIAVSFPIHLWLTGSTAHQLIAALTLCGLGLNGLVETRGEPVRWRTQMLVFCGALLLAPIISLLLIPGGDPRMDILALAASLFFIRSVWRMRQSLIRREDKLKQAIATAQTHESLARQLFEQNTGSVVVLDLELRVVAVSDGVKAGLTDADCIGKKFTDIAPCITQEHCDIYERAFAGERCVTVEEKILYLGQERYVTWNVAPWRTVEGDIAGIIINANDVTDLVAARRAAQDEAALSAMLLDQAPINAVLFDTEQRLVSKSKRANKYFDGRPVMGRRPEEIAPNCTQAWRDAIRDALHGVVTQQTEEKMLLSNGRALYFNWEVRPWYDASGAIKGCVSYSHDVTHIVVGRMAEKVWYQRLRIALEESQSVVIELNVKRKSIEFFGDPAPIYGFTPSYEDITSPESYIYLQEDVQSIQSDYRENMKSGKSETLTRIRRPDGAEAFIRVNSRTSFEESGEPESILVIVKEVTLYQRAQRNLLDTVRRAHESLESKRAMLRDISIAGGELFDDEFNAAGSAKSLSAAEAIAENGVEQAITGLNRILYEVDARDAALARAVDFLRRAREESDAANLAKSQFLATMSHELRTPLNAVIGYSEMLMEAAEEDERRSDIEDITRILSAARALLRLINELLDLSKIEAGHMDITLEEYEPALIINSVINTILPQLQKNGNRIECNVATDIGLGHSDSFKLSQCLLNLMSNAVKFTQDGVISVSARIEPSETGDRLEISVTDSGIGMTEKQLTRLFKPFSQGDSSTTRKYGGTGLGLVITRKLMNLLGGDVSVTSEAGEGSTFTLCAPLRLEPQTEKQDARVLTAA